MHFPSYFLSLFYSASSSFSFFFLPLAYFVTVVWYLLTASGSLRALATSLGAQSLNTQWLMVLTCRAQQSSPRCGARQSSWPSSRWCRFMLVSGANSLLSLWGLGPGKTGVRLTWRWRLALRREGRGGISAFLFMFICLCLVSCPPWSLWHIRRK